MLQTFQRTDQAVKDEYALTKKQIDEQFKKDQRRAKKAKEEAGWQALAFFEGSKDEGTKWRRGVEANWAAAKEDLHIKQDDAEIVLKRCGKLADASLPVAEATVAEAICPSPPRRLDRPRRLSHRTRSTREKPSTTRARPPLIRSRAFRSSRPGLKRR